MPGGRRTIDSPRPYEPRTGKRFVCLSGWGKGGKERQARSGWERAAVLEPILRASGIDAGYDYHADLLKQGFKRSLAVKASCRS